MKIIDWGLSRMRNQIKVRLHKELGFLILLPLLMGMTPLDAQQMYYDLNCTATPQVGEECVQIACAEVADMVKFYVVEWDTGGPVIPPVEPPPTDPPDCIPTWCSLPLQDCELPPRTDGFDSCGNPCSKPSPEWPNCIN